MFMPSIIDDNLFDDWFDDDFYMPYVPDMSRVDKKLYGNKAAREMKTDVKETDQGYEVAVDLPGVKKDDVTVELKDGYLTISAKKNVGNDKKDKNGKYIRRERRSSSYQRSFHVEGLKPEDIIAQYRNGVLTVNLPKKEAIPEKEEAIQIEVKD